MSAFSKFGIDTEIVDISDILSTLKQLNKLYSQCCIDKEVYIKTKEYLQKTLLKIANN